MSFWKDKVVLVTGGSGFVGQHVLSALESTPCSQIVLPRSAQYDLTQEAAVKQLFSDYTPDVLIHLAGHVGGLGINNDYPVDFFYRNIMMNTLTIHQAWKAGVKKILTTGAGCGYPEHAPIPLKESDFWSGYPQPESAPYSLAKRMLHVQSDAYFRQYRLPIVVLLPGNVYGPHDNFDLEAAHVAPALVRRFVEAIDDGHDEIMVWGDGSPTRDFVYAGDVAKGIIAAGEQCNAPELINLSSGQETAILTLVETLVDITGYTGKIVWNSDKVSGQSRRLFDVSKAKDILGFSADTPLRDGLIETVDWYRANRETARNTMPKPAN